MTVFLWVLYLIEFLCVSFVGYKIRKERSEHYKLLFIIALIAAVQILSSSLLLVDIKGIETGSFLYDLFSYLPSVIYLCSDFLLICIVVYVFTVLKFTNSYTYLAFGILVAGVLFDSFLIATNPVFNFSFELDVIPLWDSDYAPANFVLVTNKWFFFHQVITLTMELLVLFAILLKCSTLPFINVGKYFFLCFAICISGLLNIIYVQISMLTFRVQYQIFFTDLFPVFLYIRFNHYRPRIIKPYIRQFVLDQIGAPVVYFDINNTLLDFNKDAEELFELNKNQIDHLNLGDFLKKTTGNLVRQKNTSTVEEIAFTLPSGLERIYKMDYSCLNDEYGRWTGTLLVYHDVTELKMLFNTMEKTAMTDGTTGLSSAASLKRKITEINLYRKFPYSAVVCELNGYNLIQEGFGEEAAKKAVIHMCEVLRKQLRASDFASYSEGQVTVLMPETDVAISEKVIKRAASILEKDNTFNFMLSLDYGIASKPTKDSDMQLTVSQASARLAKNKVVKGMYVQDSIISSLQTTLKNSSFETKEHSERVMNICCEMAKKLKLSKSENEKLKTLALYHDIGKLSVPESILLKNGCLTDEERQVMILHSINGFKIANCSAELGPVAREILCHHEYWDGKGYPNGYKGEDIPLLSRIVLIADTFDAMTHERPYAGAVSVEEAKAEILKLSGKRFDPEIIQVFDMIPVKELNKLI